MAQQSFRTGFPPPEGLEHFHGMAAAAEGQDRITEPLPGFGQSSLVGEARFFKRSEGVGAEDFGPEIAVVACGVAAGEDMAEGTEKSVFRQRFEDGRLGGDATADIPDGLVAVRSVTVVEFDIRPAEADLAQDGVAGHEGTGSHDFLVQLLR